MLRKSIIFKSDSKYIINLVSKLNRIYNLIIENHDICPKRATVTGVVNGGRAVASEKNISYKG